jgi:hypothetical protein
MRLKRRLDFLTEDNPCVLQGVKCLEEASREMRNWAVAVLFLLSCRAIIRWLFRDDLLLAEEERSGRLHLQLVDNLAKRRTIAWEISSFTTATGSAPVYYTCGKP